MNGQNRRINIGFLRKITENEEQESTKRQTFPFMGEELEDAIKLTKKGKEPGPDNIRMELIKWLGGTSRKWLLNTNLWWKEQKAPEEIYHASNSTTDKASNYRPISLLSSFCKLYMILIRTRVQAEIGKRNPTTQHGFRPAESTAHAIYIITRIQDFAPKTREPLYMTLPDRENNLTRLIISVSVTL